MKLKPGVKLTDLQPQLALAALIVDACYRERGLPCVITSANDSTHSANSWHYKGRALDFRTHYEALNGQEMALLAEVKEALGAEFDVVMEGVGTPQEHLHIEWEGDRNA